MDGVAIAPVALYAGLNALILFWLTRAVVSRRLRLKVLLGDGGEPELARAMRGQANFAELVPMALLLLLVAALMGAPGWAIHLLGAVLTGARLLHAWHFLSDGAPMWQRVVSTVATVAVIATLAIGLIGHALIGAV